MFLQFPSIGQFSQFVSTYKKYIKDKNKNDENKSNESLTFTGTVKLHGTNAAIGFSKSYGLWFQSHKRIITPELDNFKFATTMTEHSEDIKELMISIAETYAINLDENILVVYGEWCGDNIQKNIGISGLPRMFVIFDLAYFPSLNSSNMLKEKEGEDSLQWLPLQKFHIPTTLNKIVYNILEFQTFEIKVDFDKLPEVRNQLISITQQVEKECPVAKYFGKSGIGEGIVWRAQTQKVFRFKVKGDEHATSKVTKMAAVDVEKLKSLNEFLKKSVTENRLMQGISEIFGDEEVSSAYFSRLGKFTAWVVGDVKKEDMDAFPNFPSTSNCKVSEKELNRAITARASKWFKEFVEDNIMSK